MNYNLEKNSELKLVKKLSILGFFVISILGTLLHFSFEFFNNNLFVATFSAVNESIWEHIKIAVMPTFLWTIIELIILKYRQDNLWSSLLIKIVTIIITIILGFYCYTAIVGHHILWIDILLFYISILLGQFFSYKEIKSKKVKILYEEISKYLVLIIFLMFVLFTFLPPKLEIFKDEVTSTYGVFKIDYKEE